MRFALLVFFVLMGGYFLVNSRNMPLGISELMLLFGGLIFLFGSIGIIIKIITHAKSPHRKKRKFLKKQRGFLEKKGAIYLKNTPQGLE